MAPKSAGAKGFILSGSPFRSLQVNNLAACFRTCRINYANEVSGRVLVAVSDFSGEDAVRLFHAEPRRADAAADADE